MQSVSNTHIKFSFLFSIFTNFYHKEIYYRWRKIDSVLFKFPSGKCADILYLFAVCFSKKNLFHIFVVDPYALHFRAKMRLLVAALRRTLNSVAHLISRTIDNNDCASDRPNVLHARFFCYCLHSVVIRMN